MSPEQVVPGDHPLRAIKKLADVALGKLSPTFDRMYSGLGRPSVPPERLLKSMLLIAFYSVRSERQFCEQLRYNMLFRWFLDMDMVEDVFDASTFSQNRDRLLEHDVAGEFLRQVVAQAKGAHLMSRDHFTVDGTMIEAWASLKSFKRKDARDDDQSSPDDPGNPTVNFHGEKRSNETHASTTDPEAKLARKGANREAKLSFMAHALMENRNGLIVDFRVSEANGRAEREQALVMVERSVTGERRITLGADKADALPRGIADAAIRSHAGGQLQSAPNGTDALPVRGVDGGDTARRALCPGSGGAEQLEGVFERSTK
jgi:transposase